jgi:nitrate reductase beta subunit
MKEELHSRCVIQENAKRVTELHDHIHETLKRREVSPEGRADWSRACEEFHSKYDKLAFPCGYEAGLRKIQAGDAEAIEDALAFLEVRPYFFRSQYIRTKLTRLLKHAQLTARQTARFQRVLESDKQKRK